VGSWRPSDHSQTDDHSPRRILILVRLDGTCTVLWSPTKVQALYGVAAPDGRHVAIISLTERANVWLLSAALP
jgi:hypothetical protein